MHRGTLSISLLVMTLSWPPPAAQTSRERLLNTVLSAEAEVRLPASADNIGDTLASIAKATGVAIGFETVMDDEPGSRLGSVSRSLGGMTLAQALDGVVAMDSRYAWRERRGVIHVRPKEAFDDARHFLNRRVERFELRDAIPLHATFEVHRIYRPDCKIRHPIYTDERDAFLAEQLPADRKGVTVSLTNVSVLDILDAVIKAHGELHWNVTYKVPPDVPMPKSAVYAYAVFSFHSRPSVGGWWRMCVGDENQDPG
jgi:hypothetical protein